MQVLGMSFSKKVEIEIESIHQLREISGIPVDIIMLDNMGAEKASKAAEYIRNEGWPGKDVLIEISGNITPENIRDYAPLCDIISLGALTHSPRALDISLKLL